MVILSPLLSVSLESDDRFDLPVLAVFSISLSSTDQVAFNFSIFAPGSLAKGKTKRNSSRLDFNFDKECDWDRDSVQ